ncbi:MAG: hypothetical protein HY803_13935 [candidate division NC10 bacterium]|nr:hypothetical protein [candidate division NC10 bacterium]
MFDRGFTGTDLAIGLAAFLLMWDVAGIQVNRRRAVTLVRQVRDSIQPFGGTATIRWIGRSAFRIEAEQLTPPFVRLGISVLLEPRETFFLWAFGRLGGRRDWLVIGVTLNGRVGASFEVYHPRRRGATQVAHDIREKGWREEPLAGRPPLLCAGPDADGRALARAVMSAIGGTDVWRVGLQPEAPHLIVSLPVPATETRTPLPIFAALSQLAQTVLARGPGR